MKKLKDYSKWKIKLVHVLYVKLDETWEVHSIWENKEDADKEKERLEDIVDSSNLYLRVMELK